MLGQMGLSGGKRSNRKKRTALRGQLNTNGDKTVPWLRMFKADEGDAPSCVECARDWVLDFLSMPLLSFWTIVNVVYISNVIGWGAGYFFLLIGFHKDRDDINWYENLAIQVLTGLFTYGAIISLPWRFSNAHHLWCSRRSSQPGRDFYGRPTDAIWFHIPTLHRKAITFILLVGPFAQFANQALRCIYYSYEAAEAEPFLMLFFFLLSFACMFVGGAYQVLQERRLRQQNATFPSGVFEDVGLLYRHWHHGIFHVIPGRVPSRQPQTYLMRCCCLLPGVGLLHAALCLLGDVPWLLHAAFARAKVPANHDNGPTLEVVGAGRVPFTRFKLFVTVSVSTDGDLAHFDYVGRTPVAKRSYCRWEDKEILGINEKDGEWGWHNPAKIRLGAAASSWGSKAVLKLTLCEDHALCGAHAVHVVGSAFAEATNVKGARGVQQLLLEDIDGDPVLSGEPLRPCFVKCAYSDDEATDAPALSLEGGLSFGDSDRGGGGGGGGGGGSGGGASCAVHALIISRGTRGDVQPFVALTRGLCSQLGWRVTFCTEERWRGFVLGKCADITAGEVRFLCTGGDTQRQTETDVSKEIMSSRTEVLQELMMAASEMNFFPSAPVIMHHLGALQASPRPVDVIINAFTLTGVALMCGEAYGVPAVGFCLQPSCIPSADDDWHAVLPVDGGGLSCCERIEELACTSHASLKTLRDAMEKLPFSSLSLPAQRAQWGLTHSDTWKAAFKWKLPIVIPMLPAAFKRPSDWPDSFKCTDFIFLRSSAPGGGALEAPIDRFVKNARGQGKKLMVMTFSSMPVPRAAALAVAVRMLTESKHAFALLYVGKRQSDTVPAAVAAKVEELKAQGSLLEAERADFGVLFREMDAFIVHGGLGSTVEALRMKRPVAVTGILLMDQRFWGWVCYDKGVGPKPMHIDAFEGSAVDWADKALDPLSDYTRNAAKLTFGDEADDGVAVNVHEIARLVASELPPPKSHTNKSSAAFEAVLRVAEPNLAKRGSVPKPASATPAKPPSSLAAGRH